MKYTVFVFTILLMCAGIGSGKSLQGRSTTKEDFDEFQRNHPNDVFIPGLDLNIQRAITEFQNQRLLPNGLRYGDSVRNYRMYGKSLSQIRNEMREMKCLLKEDVLRDPENNEPKFVAGRTLPIWIFLCPDGGVVRIKPQGDPTNPWRPYPHGSKSLRYPYNAKFENFSDEVVKVDSDGNAVPKSRAHLRPQHLVDGWSTDAHSGVIVP